MSETESAQLRRERLAGVGTVALVCLAFPSVLLMVFDTSNATNRHKAMSWFLESFAAGVLVPTLYWSSYHALGFAPVTVLVWLVAVVVFTSPPPPSLPLPRRRPSLGPRVPPAS